MTNTRGDAARSPSAERLRRLLIELSPLLFLIPLFSRVAVIFERTTKWGVIFNGPDAYYHARRIMHAVDHFPHIFRSDAALSVADPIQHVPWPHLFDLFATLLVYPWTFIYSDPLALEVVAALVPPMIGLLTIVILVYWLAVRYGAWPALLGGMLLSFSPAHVQATMFGNLDHHSMEALFILLAAIALCEAPRLTRLQSLAAGLVLGLGCGFAQVIWLYLMIVLTLNAVGVLLKRSSAMFGIGMCLSMLAIISVESIGAPGWSYQYISWFHTLPIVPFLAISVIHEYLSQSTLSQGFRITISLALFICISLGLLIAFPMFTEIVLGGSSFLGRNPVIQLISESRPFLATPAARFGYLGYLFYLVPVWLVIDWLSQLRKKAELPISFLTLLTILYIMVLMQLRFAAAITTILSIYLALKLCVLLPVELLQKRGHAVLVLVCAVLLNSFNYVPEMLSVRRFHLSDSKEERQGVMRWFADQSGRVTPPQPYSMNLKRVMAEWYLGHELIYSGRSAVVTNPFIFDIASPGLMDSLRFFYEMTEEQAYSYAIAHHIEYVLARPLPHDLPKIAAVLDKPVDYFVRRRDGHYFDLLESYRATLAHNLGMLTHRNRPKNLSRFQLVYESRILQSPFKKFDSEYKIYRVVKGAEVTLRGPKLSTIDLYLQVRSNQNRILSFHWQKRTDRRGMATFRLPYPTAGLLGHPDAPVETANFYWPVIDEQEMTPFQLLSDAVENGLKVEHRIRIHQQSSN